MGGSSTGGSIYIGRRYPVADTTNMPQATVEWSSRELPGLSFTDQRQNTYKYLLVKNLERSDWLARAELNKGNEGSDSGAIIWRLCVEGRLLAAG